MALAGGSSYPLSYGRRRSAPARAIARLLRPYDRVLLAASVLLAAYGTFILYSATRVYNADHGLSPSYYLVQQGLFDLVGVAGMAVVLWLGYRFVLRFGGLVYAASLLSLVAIFSPLGRSALGAQRWFPLGPFKFQPSSFAILALVLGLAAVLDRFGEDLPARRVAVLVAMVGVPVLLVAKQPDLGTAIVMGVTSSAVLVVGGVRGRHLLLLALLAALAVIAVLHFGLLHRYQLERLIGFVQQHNTALSAKVNYDVNQSKLAISSGGLTGVGPFHGLETNGGFVPESTTDFIFSAVGQQFGFFGGAALLGLYGVVIWRIWRIAVRTGDRAGRLVCSGVVAYLGFSVFQNMGMAMGIMPVAGIPLPLVSSGGSAVLATFLAIGLALSVGATSSPS